MKKIKKILKWTGLILLAIIAGITVITASRQDLHFSAPYPEIHASRDSAVIARGRHLVTSVAHCTECHSTVNADSIIQLGQDPPMSGGVAFKLPVGTIYSANISTDSSSGIGRYTDGAIARVLRYGVHPNGNAVFDFMPFHNISNEDLTAIVSYLRIQQPVAAIKPVNQLNAAGKLVNAFLVKPVGPSETIVNSVHPDTTAAYGKYLVLNMGNCSGCHTQRSMSGAYTGALLAGGNPMDNGIIPPNLTPDSSSRIFGWTLQTFVNRFRMGKLNAESHMPWNCYKRMTNDELKAIYHFLQTVPPAKTPAYK